MNNHHLIEEDDQEAVERHRRGLRPQPAFLARPARCEMVRARGKRVTNDTGFPIFKSADVSEFDYVRKVQGVPKVAVDFIKEAEPYQGAGNPFWRLHQLDITDKHKLLVPVGMAHWALSANALSLPRTDGELLQQAVIPTF